MRARLAAVVTVCLAFPALAEEDVTVSYYIAERGEPKYAEGFEHWDYVNPDAPRTGSVTYGARGTFDNFNRFALRGTTPASIASYLFDTLMVGNSDEVGVYYGLIAEQVEYPATNDWIIFHLNPAATFQDGSPIEASDVAFTFNLLMTDGVPQFRNIYEGVTVEVLDTQRVRFDLPGPSKSDLVGLAALPVLPEHDFADRDFSEPFEDVPLGSGAYTISEYEMGQYVVYERIDDYWAINHPTQLGQLNIDRERVDYYLDDTVLLEAFKKGDYDYRTEASARKWATQYTGSNFEDGYIIKESIPHEIPTGMQGFVFNIQRPVFEDRRVRMAINQLFDFEWTNDNLLYGYYNRTYSYFQNTEYMATGLPQGQELAILEEFRGQIPDEVFTEPYSNVQTDGSGNIRPQLRQALTLLREAGYESRDGQMVNVETGEPLSFELLLYRPDNERIAIPFKENLAKAGINMTIRTVDTTQYVNRLRERDFDMVSRSFFSYAYPNDNLRIQWGSGYLDSSYNMVGTQDPVIDALIQGVMDNQQDEELLLAYGRALDRVLLWRYYAVPQWHNSEHWVAYWNKFGRPERLPRYSLGASSWWYDAQAAQTLPERNGR